MERICADEILQLIFFELPNPTSFTLASKRFHALSQDPYVRAHYFLSRYGRMEAMYWALSRGRILTNRVIDIAMHHYFRTVSHPFIKTTWTRSMPTSVFAHLMVVAADMYGHIPQAKGEDDGSIFSNFLTQSHLPADRRMVKWEEVRDILGTYKYRDFVFRKMFEKVSSLPEDRTDTIVQNVRELRKLDTSMFLSRTVAAEICMEARTNEAAYSALKKLNESGDLLFELSANVPGSSVVEELLKLFIKTRSITNNSTIPVLRALYSDFPSTDPTVRLVIILTVFVPTTPTTTPTMTAPAMRAKLESLGVAPLSRTDIVNVLLNPFIDRHRAVIDYAKVVIGMDPKEIHELVEEVAIKCLEVGCKGKLLRRLVDGYAHLKEVIAAVVVEKYQLGLEQLPDADDEEACARYRASLCREYCFLVGLDGTEPVQEGEGEDVVMDEVDGEDGEVEEESVDELEALPEGEVQRDVSELGSIGQDTLTNMIRQEESYNRGYRRRGYYRYGYSDMSAKLTYPADSLQVGKWIKEQFGLRSPVTAVFMIHAVVNDSLGAYLPYDDVQNHVPITLQHFKLLARLGRGTCWSMYRDIEKGAEFYFDASDYLNSQPMAKVKAEVKTEVAQLAIPPVASSSRKASSSRLLAEKNISKRRPRRSVASGIRSYAVPDSDDEDIADVEEMTSAMQSIAKRRKVETNLQRWIKELSVLLKEEQRKYKEKRKRVEKAADPDTKIRLNKSEFMKTLASNLRSLRKKDLDKRRELYGPDVEEVDYSEGEDDEYQIKTTRARKRKIAS
ncbi:hypothetical protein HWV62_25194 [Athelia sp. TMB]|nr:hypothetical protein HWV62_25194 [Athelia sp. TMB]